MLCLVAKPIFRRLCWLTTPKVKHLNDKIKKLDHLKWTYFLLMLKKKLSKPVFGTGSIGSLSKVLAIKIKRKLSDKNQDTYQKLGRKENI